MKKLKKLKSTSKKSLLLSFMLVPLFFVIALITIAITSFVNSSNYYKSSNNSNSSITTVTQKQNWTEYSAKDIRNLTQNKKIIGNFIAQTNNLGLISIPFNTHNKSINDRIIFRLKESGTKNWYIENTYAANQIQTNAPFPFGFPIIKNSKNKLYTFEIESHSGTPSNSISLSKINFYFLNGYKFSKSELMKNPYILAQFLYYKTIDYISFLNIKNLNLADFFLLLFFSFSPVIAVFINSKFSLLRRVFLQQESVLDNAQNLKQTKENSKEYIYGIDYLRVIFSISVVMWHEIGKNSPLPHNSATTLVQYIFGVFNLDFLLVAVPSFFLVSCFLFLYRGGTLERLKSNVKQLILLFLFWTVITDLLVGDTKDILFLYSPHNLTEIFTLLTGGAFGLYYFLISLIIVQMLTYMIKNLRFIYVAIGLILSSITIFVLSFYAEKTGNSILVQYFSPISFIMVPFLAVLLYRLWNFDKLTKVYYAFFFLALGAIARFAEWYFLIHYFFIHNIQPGFPLYARPSLYILGMFLIIIAFVLIKKSPRFISLISRYTLAIYVTHILFLSLSRQITQNIYLLFYLHINDLVTTFLCVAFAMIFAKIFSHYIKREVLFT